MTPWVWYMVGLCGAISMSLTSVVVSGALHPIWALLIPVGLYLSYRRALGRSIGGFSATLIGLGGFAVGATSLSQLGTDGLVLAGAQTILVLLIARLASSEDLEHDQQCLAISLLIILTATILNLGLSFGVILVFYAIFASWALLGRQMVRGLSEQAESDSNQIKLPARHMVGVAVLALGLIAGSSLLFILFPRIGLNSFGLNSGRAMGLPDEVNLDGGKLVTSGDNIVAARVTGLNPNIKGKGLYLRFEDYPTLTSNGFRTEPLDVYEPESPLLRRRSDEPLSRYTVQLAAHGSVELPSLGLVRSVRVLEGGTPNPSRTLRVLGLSRGGLPVVNRIVTGPIRYEIRGPLAQVQSLEDSEPVPVDVPNQLKSLLQVPSNVDEFPQLEELVNSHRSDGSESSSSMVAIVSHFETTLRQQFRYSLELPELSQNSLYQFLLSERQGHCEYFAAALTLLLRLNGIPARVVGGFAGGTWDQGTGTLVFQGRHAHAWVEWWSPEQGWQLADGTPASGRDVEFLSGLSLFRERLQRFWDDKVVDFGWQEQVQIARGVAEESKDIRSLWNFSIGSLNWKQLGAVVFAVLAFGVLGYLVWNRRERQRWGPLRVLEYYSGVSTFKGETLKMYLRRLGDEDLVSGDLSDQLSGLAASYERFRFGGDNFAWTSKEKELWRRHCIEVKTYKS